MTIFYLITTAVSLLALLAFIVISDRKVLFYNASFFIFAFIANLGYLFISQSKNVEEAIIANKITYISGCMLSLFLMMLVCDACRIELKKSMRLAMYGYSALVLILSLSVGYTDWFYKKCSIETRGGITVLVKEYAFGHTLFLIMLYGYLLAGVAMLSYALIKRKKLIYSNISLMILLYGLTILFYTLGRKLFLQLDPICVSYCIDDVILLFITYNTGLYNLDEALLTSIEKQDSQGYLLFDNSYRLLAYNKVAIKLIPELVNQDLAKKLNTQDSDTLARIEEHIVKFTGDDDKEIISSNDKDIEVSAQYLYRLNRIRGYIVRLIDDSKQQEYIRKLDLVATSKSNFLSNVSHEIRTPINSILGMNEMILRECNESHIRDYATIIASSGQTLLQLVNDVLDLTKIESGKSEVLPVEYGIADVIRDLENMIRPIIKKEKLEFIVETSDNLPKVLYGDVKRIKQMATNILSNAVKYTDEGTIRFIINGKRKGNSFVFKYIVKDTGRGIKEADMDKLFDAFERVDQRKNSGILGTGLGLAITKKYATMMGGDVEVESRYGEGSTFTITIPQKIVDFETLGTFSSDSYKASKENYKESFHAPTAKILAVDDVEINLMVVELLLKEIGMQIECCNSGKECIELVKNGHYDIILLDHMMPEPDGIETLNIIRQEHYADDTPIIALTANTEIDAEKTYLEYGFDGYLPKPVFPEQLEKMIYDNLPKEKIC